jgi:hypothetical protein
MVCGDAGLLHSSTDVTEAFAGSIVSRVKRLLSAAELMTKAIEGCSFEIFGDAFVGRSAGTQGSRAEVMAAHYIPRPIICKMFLRAARALVQEWTKEGADQRLSDSA